MLKEAIDRIAELGVSASGVEVHRLCNRKVIVRKGTTFETIETDPDPRNYATEDCQSFVSLVNRVSEDAIVFVDSSGATAVLNEEHRADRVVMSLKPSRAFQALMSLGQPRDQRYVIARLREELSGCFPEMFLAVVRRLDFSRNSDGRSHIQHGRESLGKSVEAAVQSADGDIPERVSVALPLWMDNGLESVFTITCAVTIDPVQEKISICPIGDEIDQAKRVYSLNLSDRLSSLFAESGDQTLVVLGNP